ncbi:MAG: hypothetical protein Q8Q09_13625 [Deltaproteobacteria bacterium]|nr:hypothetical protein [Deltaproteobacteria bacterium]
MRGSSSGLFVLSLVVFAGCYDWDRFSRPRDGSIETDAGEPRDVGQNTDTGTSVTGTMGEVLGDFSCARPVLHIPVTEPRYARIERFSIVNNELRPCRPLPVWGITGNSIVRAVAVAGDQVLAATESGACFLTVQDGRVQGQFRELLGPNVNILGAMPWTQNGVSSFAVSLLDRMGTNTLSSVYRWNSVAWVEVILPTMFRANFGPRALATDPTDSSLVYAGIVQNQFLLSARTDGSAVSVVASANEFPPFNFIHLGHPLNGQPNIVVTPQSGSNVTSIMNSTQIRPSVCACPQMLYAVAHPDQQNPPFVICSTATGTQVTRSGCAPLVTLPGVVRAPAILLSAR